MRSVEQKMFKCIRGWQQSGLAQKAWCKKSNIAYATFHYWYKKFREKEAMGVGKGDEGKFVQLVMDSANSSEWWCEIRVANGRKLVFRQPVSPELLQTLIG